MQFKTNRASLENFRSFCLHFEYAIQSQRSCHWVKGIVWVPLPRDRTWNRFPLSKEMTGPGGGRSWLPWLTMFMFKYSRPQPMYVSLRRIFQFHFAYAGQKLSWNGSLCRSVCLVLSLFCLNWCFCRKENCKPAFSRIPNIPWCHSVVCNFWQFLATENSVGPPPPNGHNSLAILLKMLAHWSSDDPPSRRAREIFKDSSLLAPKAEDNCIFLVFRRWTLWK